MLDSVIEELLEKPNDESLCSPRNTGLRGAFERLFEGVGFILESRQGSRLGKG